MSTGTYIRTTSGPCRLTGGCIAAIVLAVVFAVGVIILAVFLSQKSKCKSGAKKEAVAYNSRTLFRPSSSTSGRTRPLLAGAGLPMAEQPMTTVGEASARGRASAYQRAQEAERRSMRIAQGKPLNAPAPAPAPSVAVQLPPGASDMERHVAAQVAYAKSQVGMLPDGTGQMAPLIMQPAGDALMHMGPTKINHTGGTTAASFGESDLALYDPEGAAKLDAAMTLSGTPAAFHMDDQTERARRSAEIVKSMMLTGTVDPSIDDVMGASSPFIATSAMIRRATASQAAIDRATVIETPLRFFYQPPLYRPATAMPTMSPIPGDNMTAGQQFYYQSLACQAQGLPVTQESY